MLAVDGHHDLGLTRREVDWLSEDEVRKLARKINVKPPPKKAIGERVR